MKRLLTVLLTTVLVGSALADIHLPPQSQYTPARKFGRGLSNFFFGFSEIPVGLHRTTELNGNSAAWGYGIVRSVRRAFYRSGMGAYEMATCGSPAYRNSFQPVMPSDLIWGEAGFSEFPPELGFETRYIYCRTYGPQ